MEKTLIYHYTSLSHIIEIFRTGKLLTSQTEKMLKVKKPALWFTTNSKWEYSAFKRFNDGKKEFDLNTPEEFEKYIGCARFVTNLNSLFVTFAKYKHKSKVNPLLWDKMAEIGKSKGADPSEWYATFSPMSVNNLDIEIYEDESRKTIISKFFFLRQQINRKSSDRANFCLADFVAPKKTGIKDYIGAFVVTAGEEIEKISQNFDRVNDDYNSILVKSLGDRIAEALAEKTHEDVRKIYWGYSKNEKLNNEELIKEKYHGIRPAPGYPACPDHTEKTTLFEMLEIKNNLKIELTESFAMTPTSSVAGLYFSHPNSSYFGIGKIGEDQVEDYAKRKGDTKKNVEKWLGPSLSYSSKKVA